MPIYHSYESLVADSPDTNIVRPSNWNQAHDFEVAHSELLSLTADDHTQYVLRAILTTNGDMFVRLAGVVNRLPTGAANQLLGISGGLPSWQSQTYIDHASLSNLATGDPHPQYRQAAVAIAHNTLSGLTADDHTLYLKEKASGGLAAELPEHTHSGASEGGVLATIDHGGLGGLTDDDHGLYLKEKASGGLASELPEHDHTSSSQGGTIPGSVTDHGALTGLADDDHTQYVLRTILTTNGDIFVRLAGVVDRLAAGGANTVLGISGGLPSWQAQSYIDHGNLTGLADDDHTQYVLRSILTTNGDIYIRSGGVIARLGVGAANTVLGVSASLPAWQAQTYIDHGSITGNADDDHTQYVLRSILTTNGDIFIRSGGVIARLGVGSANQILGVSSSLPAWSAQTYIDHGSISGLTDDDHSQYALLAGRSGGQTLNGGTAAGDDAHINGTANATKGSVFLADDILEIDRPNVRGVLIQPAGTAASTYCWDYEYSGMAHGITSQGPTDSWALVKRYDDNGGYQIRAFSKATNTFILGGIYTTGNTTHTGAAVTPIWLFAAKKSGTTAGSPAANENLFGVGDGSAMKFIVDAEGDFFYDGTGTAFDGEEDLRMLEAFNTHFKGERASVDAFFESRLIERGVLHLGDAEFPNTFVSGKRLNLLQVGGMLQLEKRINELEEKLKAAGVPI